MQISKNLEHYIYLSKLYKRNEIYEVLCLMILNDSYLKALENLIVEHIKNFRFDKKNINLVIKTTPEYIKAVNTVFNSSYFIKNFSKEEIERKKIIANNIMVEIISSLASLEIAKGCKKNIRGIKINYFKTMFPTINHKLYKENNIEKIGLTFTSDTPLNELIDYLKMIDIKNSPKKRKMSLGQSIRLLHIENNIRKNKEKYKNKKYKHIGGGKNIECSYIEQLIARELYEVYGEEISEELISKSLQRIKKIKKEINQK